MQMLLLHSHLIDPSKRCYQYIFLSCNGFISTALQVFALIFKALMSEREIDVTTAIEIFGLD